MTPLVTSRADPRPGLRRPQRSEVKIFATALAAGILIDATIVRGILVPAIVAILGRWNWWLPHWPARVLRVRPSLVRREPAIEEA